MCQIIGCEYFWVSNNNIVINTFAMIPLHFFDYTINQ